MGSPDAYDGVPGTGGDREPRLREVTRVLARGEIESSYQQSRQLFARARHGHYLPNPAMLLRQNEGWVPVYDALGLDWLEAGCRSEDGYVSSPAGVVARSKSEIVEPQRDLGVE